MLMISLDLLEKKEDPLIGITNKLLYYNMSQIQVYEIIVVFVLPM